MLNIKKFYAWIVNGINSKVNRSGDTLSGELKVVIPDGSDHAKLYTECHDSGGNLVSAGALESSLSGNVGFYDYKHGKWVIRNDADGKQHIPISLTWLYSSRVTCTTVGTSFKYTTIAGLANWHVVAVHFTVYETTQVLFFVRGEQIERMLTDAPNLGRFRGGITVDWNNNRIGIRAIAAGSSNNYPNNISFDYVFGVL